MNLVVDSSAWLAILFGEPERAAFVEILARSAVVNHSAVTVLECGLVARGRLGADGARLLEKVQREVAARPVPFDAAQAVVALEAFERFGKGRHRAALNLGDCCSYAAARALSLPLLCKGDDFRHTDIALVPW